MINFYFYIYIYIYIYIYDIKNLLKMELNKKITYGKEYHLRQYKFIIE